MPDNITPQPVIKVFGIGGAGRSISDRLVTTGLSGAALGSMQLDPQMLQISAVPEKVILGSRQSFRPHLLPPDILSEKLKPVFQGTDIVILTAGMGGSTTETAPVIARIAKEMGTLTLCVVTLPFAFEGRRKLQRAEEGITSLLSAADGVMVITNEELKGDPKKKLTLQNAFGESDMAIDQRISLLVAALSQSGFEQPSLAAIREALQDAGIIDFVHTTHRDSNDVLMAAEQVKNSRMFLTGILGARRLLLHFSMPP